jgi:hypothetical protein
LWTRSGAMGCFRVIAVCGMLECEPTDAAGSVALILSAIALAAQ